MTFPTEVRFANKTNRKVITFSTDWLTSSKAASSSGMGSLALGAVWDHLRISDGRGTSSRQHLSLDPIKHALPLPSS